MHIQYDRPYKKIFFHLQKLTNKQLNTWSSFTYSTVFANMQSLAYKLAYHYCNASNGFLKSVKYEHIIHILFRSAALALRIVITSSCSENWGWSGKNGGMFKNTPGGRSPSMANPLSAITSSPGDSNFRIPQSLVICRSDVLPA